jgi:hypothetical protein
MPQQESSQVSKLQNRKIRRQRRLLSLFSNNPDSYMSRLNHTHIISAVSNRCYTFIGVIFNEGCDFGFLGR